MKAKKFLKEQANADKRALLEESNPQVYTAEIEKNKAEAPAIGFWARNSKWILTLAGTLAGAVVLVCVFVFYPRNNVVYYEQNFVVSDSTVAELEADMKEFEINIGESYSVKVKKTTDSVSGDTLYYNVTATDKLLSLIKVEFVSVCNKDYTYPDFEISEEFIQTTLSGCTVYYHQIVSENTEYEGLYNVTAKAQIKKGNEYIYITEYTELADNEQGSLLKLIGEMFI